tara:strand:- start:261 stop:623 length:363 start_codon:yes stop_codon:yes gene_type:complete
MAHPGIAKMDPPILEKHVYRSVVYVSVRVKVAIADRIAGPFRVDGAVGEIDCREVFSHLPFVTSEMFNVCSRLSSEVQTTLPFMSAIGRKTGMPIPWACLAKLHQRLGEHPLARIKGGAR